MKNTSHHVTIDRGRSSQGCLFSALLIAVLVSFLVHIVACPPSGKDSCEHARLQSAIIEMALTNYGFKQPNQRQFHTVLVTTLDSVQLCDHVSSIFADMAATYHLDSTQISALVSGIVPVQQTLFQELARTGDVFRDLETDNSNLVIIFEDSTSNIQPRSWFRFIAD